MTAGPPIRPAYRIDGAQVSPEAFYAAACDPRSSVAVEACAGAGKTWMLVSRIVRALLDGIAPHEILAITFTRKAAGEMRTRLDEWLREFSAARCDDAYRIEALQARGLDLSAAHAAAPALGALHERVLAAGRGVEIRTFHGWFSQLLRATPLELLSELDLHPDMEIVDDLADHRSRIMRRFHRAVIADSTLGDDFGALVRSRGRTQAARWLDAAWDKRIEIELADEAGTLEGSVPPFHALWPPQAAFAHPGERLFDPSIERLLRDAAQALMTQRGKKCRQQGQQLAGALAIVDAPTRAERAFDALHTREGQRRQGIEAEGVDEAVDLLGDVQRACRQHEAHLEHRRMVRLARVLLRETAAYKRAAGLADMADLERSALALLRDKDLSGWVQERLDLRVRALLIDEFQDTSPLQWQALHAWLSGYVGAGGGASGQRPPAVFIVGDPKQSIYRFRRAEPRVFAAAQRFVVEGLGGHALACDHTRRNAPEVLGTVNAVFEAAQREGAFGGFRAHTTAVGPIQAAGVVTLGRIPRPPGVDALTPATEWRDSLTQARVEAEERLREPEARRVAIAVHDLLQREGFEPHEIHVLCRKRETLRMVARQLAALHVPHAAAEDQPLLEAPEARDLLALLDVLASPRHSLSLAHALRSPLFGASDDDLLTLADAAQAIDGDWWEALLRGGLISPVLERARTLLGRWRQAARGLPPHDLLDAIVHEGELRARVAAAVPPERRVAALAAIDALVGLALTLDGARYATPYNFVRALKRRAILVPAPVRADAVQLLTVHGAKGLEARAVFVVDADPEPRNAESASLLVDWPVDATHPHTCAFVYSETFCAPSLEILREREFAARRREELNALYVGMTRAEERLVFSATEPSRRTEPTWWDRIAPRVPSREVDKTEPSQPSDAGAPSMIELRALPPWTATTALGGAAPVAAVSGRNRLAAEDDARRLGQAVHRVLEWAAAAPIDEVDFPALAQAAGLEFRAPPGEIERLARRIRTSPACARFFGGSAAQWSGNEVAVADAGEVLRIDRLVAFDENGRRTWWVLDYKLRHEPEALGEYRVQLLRYRRAVQALEPEATVRCAFITGDGSVIEVRSEAVSAP